MNQHAPSVRRPATYQDVLDAPEGMVAELIEGALHLHPRPTLGHAVAGSSLRARSTCPFARARRPRWLVDPGGAGVHLGPTFSCPTSPAGAANGCRIAPRGMVEPPPDWVCEILSPGTRRIDLIDKRRLYAEAGYLPLVRRSRRPDPRNVRSSWRRVDARRRAEGRRGGQRPALRAISFPLSVLWPD